MENFPPPIPAKRYFTISEVSKLCGVKPHVLRYWEQEFTQLRPMKRRGNRRYYQHHEVQLIRKIRQLLYDQGFTIIGARNKLQEFVQTESDNDEGLGEWKLRAQPLNYSSLCGNSENEAIFVAASFEDVGSLISSVTQPLLNLVRHELIEIRNLLDPAN